MERKITKELLKWKIDTNKKPILLYGIPNIGKTYTCLEFGKTEYKNTIYFDCLDNLELDYVFEKNTTLEKLVRGLSAISLDTIFKGESLIIFDNISESIFKSIKKIFLGKFDYHIIMITSNEEFVTKNKCSEITFKKMGLVTFKEYLKFVGKEQLIDFIEDSFKNDKPMPFHNLAFELYNDFVLTGGYPSAITSFNESKDYNLLSNTHLQNMKLLKNKFLELDNLTDVKRCSELLDNASFQLLKDNKKFVYGLVKPGGRAKEYINALNYITKNGILIKSVKVSEITSPLSKAKDDDSFKLYYNDSGFLYRKMNVNINRLLTNDKLLEVIYENNVVETLYQNGFNIYYYHSVGKCEIDIVIQTRTGKVIPIELISKEHSSKSKSLSLTISKYNIPLSIRLGYDNFSMKKGIKYVPYYASFCITEVM